MRDGTPKRRRYLTYLWVYVATHTGNIKADTCYYWANENAH